MSALIAEQRNRPIPPIEPEIGLAKSASTRVAELLKDSAHADSIKVRVIEDGRPDEVILPVMAVRMLLDILREMAQGNAVSIIPVHAELTTQQAADFLNVSRPFFIQLLNQRKMKFTKVGTHRRVKFQDLLAYKKELEIQQDQLLSDLAKEAQELGMGY